MSETVQLPAATASGQIVTEPRLTAGSSATTAAQVGAVQWDDGEIEIRVYYPDQEKEVREYRWQGPTEWTQGITLPGSSPSTRVAAVHWEEGGDTHLRVYFQDNDNNVVEWCYDTPDWTGGHIFSGALPGTGIAALAQSAGTELRIYYQDTRNLIVEKAYDAAKGWTTAGTFYSAVPGSGIAAVYFTDENGKTHRRLYYEDGNNYILEQRWDGSSWTLGQTFSGALPRTGIAATHWWDTSNNSSHLRLYYQEGQNSIIEQVYDTSESWRPGHSFSDVTTGTGIAAVWWHDPDSHLRVYYENTSNYLIEQSYDDGTWTTGGFSVPAN